MRTSNFCVVILLAICMLCAENTRAATVSVIADADTTLYEPASSAPETANGLGESFFTGRISGGLRRRALLHFPLAAIPAGSIVTSVELTVSETRTIGGSVPTSLYRMAAAWSEGTSMAVEPAGQGVAPSAGDATWSQRIFPATAWSNPGGDASAAASASVPIGVETNYTFPSTPALIADVQSWIDSPSSNFGWQMRTDESAAPPSAKRFASRENSNPALRPRLLVQLGTPPVAVPLLDTLSVAILLLASVGLAWRSGRLGRAA